MQYFELYLFNNLTTLQIVIFAILYGCKSALHETLDQKNSLVTNLVALPTQHIDGGTTLLLHVTHVLHFPSTIALITQLSPIWLHSWIPSDTLYKPRTSSLSSPSIVCHCQYLGAVSLCVFLLTTWTVYTRLTVCCLPFWPCLSFGYSLCLPPAPIFALSLFMSQPCLRYSCYCWPNFASLTPSCLIKLHLDLNVTDTSLQVLSSTGIFEIAKNICMGQNYRFFFCAKNHKDIK